MTPADFIARQREERVAAGLPPTITDTETLRVVAALAARPHDRRVAA